jgi:hypothetical protein
MKKWFGIHKDLVAEWSQNLLTGRGLGCRGCV